MFTWKIQDGDLQVGPQGFASATGSQKIQQDLFVATAEPYGSDPFHPGWGCLLQNYIGSPIDDTTQTLITSEISRVINNYMLVQQDQLQTAANAGNANQYSSNEIISGVNSINYTQSTSTISVEVEVATQNGTVSVTTSTGN